MTYRILGALFGVALVGLACSREVIVLAEVGGEGDVPMKVGRLRCSENLDCGPDGFCERTCESPAGTCIPFPISCSKEEESPSCGCNGVTYFNDCLRRADGAPLRASGECPGPLVDCTSANEACPKGAVCARLYGFGERDETTCAAREGRCWRLPAVCPVAELGDRWDPCDENEDLRCADTCTALRSGRPFVRASRCE